MSQFMDVHSGFFGVTGDQLREAHDRDLAIEGDEGVHFERAWLDPEAGKVFCLATGPVPGGGAPDPRPRRPRDLRDLRAHGRGLAADRRRAVTTQMSTTS